MPAPAVPAQQAAVLALTQSPAPVLVPGQSASLGHRRQQQGPGLATLHQQQLGEPRPAPDPPGLLNPALPAAVLRMPAQHSQALLHPLAVAVAAVVAVAVVAVAGARPPPVTHQRCPAVDHPGAAHLHSRMPIHDQPQNQTLCLPLHSSFTCCPSCTASHCCAQLFGAMLPSSCVCCSCAPGGLFQHATACCLAVSRWSTCSTAQSAHKGVTCTSSRPNQIKAARHGAAHTHTHLKPKPSPYNARPSAHHWPGMEQSHTARRTWPPKTTILCGRSSITPLRIGTLCTSTCGCTARAATATTH